MIVTYPFIHGRALLADELLDRQRPLRRIFRRLLTKQSTAIIGQPHIGKTSLLNYIMDDTQRREMVGDACDGYIFSCLDAQVLMGSGVTQADFWQQALQPLEQFLDSFRDSRTEEVARQYALVVDNSFGNFTLERLFSLLGSSDLCFVLILDEFDVLLSHQVLNSAEFFGGLRALASRTGGLVLITASRRTIAAMNSLTQELNPYGSPFFNIFTEVNLGPLPRQDIQFLLGKAGKNFSVTDREFVQSVAGGHPYLLQVAADAVLEAHEEGLVGAERYELAGYSIYRVTKAHFADTWRTWSTPKHKALTAIALVEVPGLLSERTFAVCELVDDLPDFAPELTELKDAGVILETESGRYEVAQKAFLWWLADEIIRQVRDDETFEQWIRSQELDGVLTKGEKQRLGEAVKSLVGLARQGATTIIEAFAKGYGDALAKAYGGV
jgi:hypothetical protein